MSKKSHSQKEINKAVDGFTKSQKACSGTCKSDSIFHVGDAGKGDSPRNISNQFKKNYDNIFPNAFKPKWMNELKK
jgi:hypothetical protein